MKYKRYKEDIISFVTNYSKLSVLLTIVNTNETRSLPRDCLPSKWDYSLLLCPRCSNFLQQCNWNAQNWLPGMWFLELRQLFKPFANSKSPCMWLRTESLAFNSYTNQPHERILLKSHIILGEWEICKWNYTTILISNEFTHFLRKPEESFVQPTTVCGSMKFTVHHLPWLVITKLLYMVEKFS